MLEINNNIELVKDGIFQAINLFKLPYLNNRNVALLQDNQLFINNINRILELKPKFNDEYMNFGFNFVLNNIKNLRNNIFINPIIYLLSLEILFKNLNNTNDLTVFKNKFSKINDFIINFYNKSNLSKVKITSKDIIDSFKIKDDKFLSNIVKFSCEDYNIIIQDDKENKIFLDNFYRIKANLISGSIYGNNQKLIVTYNFDKNVFNKLVGLNENFVVLCGQINFELPKNIQNISVFKISHKILISNVYDIIKLSNCSTLFYDFETKIEDYKFGKIKSFKFINSILYLEFDKYIECTNLKKQETFDRYCMMKGKNITISCVEEYLERIHQIVTLVRCMKCNGVFYSEFRTLKLLFYYFKDNKNVNSFLYKLLYNYLRLYIDSHIKINSLINDNDLKSELDVIKKDYILQNKFMPIDLYINTFTLLNSNINCLIRVF